MPVLSVSRLPTDARAATDTAISGDKRDSPFGQISFFGTCKRFFFQGRAKERQYCEVILRQ